MSKIYIFYPKTIQAAWSLCEGMAEALRRMGHNVTNCPAPMAPSGDVGPISLVEKLKAEFPTLESLSACDVIFISGPEHIATWIDAVYGALEWRNLAVPRASFYHESSSRADGQQIDFQQVFWVGSEHFFPAVQDAELYDQEQFVGGHAHWSPFAVDTEVFKPRNNTCIANSTIGLGFIGSIYGLRMSFLEALNRFEHPPLKLGQCNYQTIDGVDIRRSMEMMAVDIRRMKIFFNLPSLSLLLVTKIAEVMACGNFLMTPPLGTMGRGHKNMVLFESGRDLVYYRAGNVAQTARSLMEWSKPEHDAEREAIARAGMVRVHREHSLETRLTWALEKMGVVTLV